MFPVPMPACSALWESLHRHQLLWRLSVHGPSHDPTALRLPHCGPSDTLTSMSTHRRLEASWLGHACALGLSLLSMATGRAGTRLFRLGWPPITVAGELGGGLHVIQCPLHDHPAQVAIRDLNASKHHCEEAAAVFRAAGQYLKVQ